MTALLLPSEIQDLRQQIAALNKALADAQTDAERANAELLIAVNALSLARIKLAILKHKLPEEQHGRIDFILEILGRV